MAQRCTRRLSSLIGRSISSANIQNTEAESITGVLSESMIPARQYRHVCTLGLLAAVICFAIQCRKDAVGVIQNAAGVRLSIAGENTQPALRVTIPGPSPAERTFEILFPEHVTGRPPGIEVEHLYMFRPGRSGEQPAWRQTGNSLEYERDFGGVHFLARATLEDDGLKIHYEFVNRSALSYSMIYAVTDPRMTGIFHDVRLERTYVHHKEGLDLLASETPGRLTMPLSRWLPARYLDSFTLPVPQQR